MTSLIKSPLADAMRDAGLSEEQIKAALTAAADVPVKSALEVLAEKAKTLGLRAEVNTALSTGARYLSLELIESGALIGLLRFWPSHVTPDHDGWTVDVTCNVNAVPSPMQRAQRLFDLHQKLVTP